MIRLFFLSILISPVILTGCGDKRPVTENVPPPHFEEVKVEPLKPPVIYTPGPTPLEIVYVDKMEFDYLYYGPPNERQKTESMEFHLYMQRLPVEYQQYGKWGAYFEGRLFVYREPTRVK